MSQDAVQLRVDGYRPGDENEILAMNLAEYGVNNVMVTPEAFHWRYSDNPAGQTAITVVRDEKAGRLVGFTWTIPLRMRLFCKDFTAVLTANQLIHPDYRDSLAYVRMSRHRLQQLRQNGVPFRFNFPIETLFQRTAAVEKMSSFLIPLLIQPLNLRQLVQKVMHNSWISSVIGLGGTVAIPLLFHRGKPKAEDNGITIEWLDQFDERFDDFWSRVKDKYPVMTARDRAFLSWRFAEVGKRSYRILAALVEGQLVGYAVLRCTDEIRSIPMGLVMDFLLEPGQRGENAGELLLDEARRYFQGEKIWLAGGLAFPHTYEYRVMQKAGYRSVPQRWSPRLFRVAFNCFDRSLPDTSQVKESDWFITIADYEAH